MDKGVINKDNFLSCGFDEIKTEYIYLEILTKAKAKNIITDLDLLNHTKNKLSSKFTSMKELFNVNLEENKLSEIFANNGDISTIASWFSNSNNEFDIKKYKLSSIVEYCKISGKLNNLNSLFTETFKEKMKNGYIPSSQKVITGADIKQIAELTGFGIDEVTKKHISIGEMASHLQPLFEGIKEATDDDIKEIKNDTIKRILLKNSVDDKDAKDFYKEITALQEDPAEDKVTKLKDFISSNKDILTYIFKKEDGLARLAGVMNSIGDGCGANIANNLNNMAISFLLDDKSKNQNNATGEKNKDIALKLIYESLIVSGILQQALRDGDHLGSDKRSSVVRDYKKDSSTDILNNRFIPPDQLIKFIAKISNFNQHKSIIPKEITNIIIRGDSEYFSGEGGSEKTIAIYAINLLIKGDGGQVKITENNSIICQEIKIKSIEAKQAEQEVGKIKQVEGGNDPLSQDDESLNKSDISITDLKIKQCSAGKLKTKSPANKIKPSFWQRLLSWISCSKTK